MRILALLGVLWALPAALAVTTSSWVQGTGSAGEGFDTGQMQEVVVGSHGDLRLSHNTHTLLKEDPRLEIVHSLLPLPDGSTVLGTGPEGVILRRAKTGEVTPLYQEGADALVTAMQLMPDGRLLAGISGAAAKLVQIDPATGAARNLWSDQTIQFVWAILPRPDGSVLLGTGPTGKLLEVSPEGRARVVFTSKQPNLMRMLADKGDDVIVGTEPEALVLRVNAKTGNWFVLYDAAEAEVAALARDGEGNIYVAATSAGPLGKPPAPAGGRPQVSPEIPLHREPPTTPQPPALPEPNPGEPEPIPKAPAPTPAPRMSILDSDVEEGDAAAPQTQPSRTSTSGSASDAGTEEGAGSNTAVYRITPAGFVTQILRRPGTAYAMVWTGNSLLLGTGPKGEVVEYRPGEEDSATLWRSDSREVSAMALMPDGSVLLGLSNPGMLVELDGGFAAKGTFLSEVLDAAQVARFGKLQLQGTLPARTGVTVATRSGNTGDPEEGGWSTWSEEAPAAEFLQVASPAARFLQYRLTLTTQDPASTPTIEQARVSYLVPNMAPKVTSVELEPAEPEDTDQEPTTSPASYTIKWEASDPNDDRLVYRLQYRLGHQGKWVLLKDKLSDTSYTWQTRKLADGRYQIRVTASDERSNPPAEAKTGERYSDPLVIDNMPPAIGDLRTAQTADGAEITLRVVDRTGTVAGVDYAVDAGDDWQAANASDMLYDSPDETVKFTVSKLAPGPHQVTVRARDAAGNTAYETLIITVPDRK